MDKEKCLERIATSGIIAVVRGTCGEEAVAIAEAAREGGIEAIEVTMTVPGALDVIRHLSARYPGGEVLIGAGTVLDSETCRSVILAGAEYVVSPCLSLETIRTCNRYRKLCIPGTMTVTEIVTALEAGADVVKVFPGNVLGPGFVKAVLGPLPHVKMIPTGGVSLDNVGQWIRNGCLAVGVGGELTSGAAEGNYSLITSTAIKFVKAVAEARG